MDYRVCEKRQHTRSGKLNIQCRDVNNNEVVDVLLSEIGSLQKRPLNRTALIFESEKLNAYIEENPDALLKDVVEHFGGSITGAFYALEREEFDRELVKISVNMSGVYVDEAEVQQEMKRTHGRSKRGVKIYVETSGKRSRKINVIAGYCNGEILGQTTCPWNTDTKWFYMWFEFVMIPLLKLSSIIVLDNASFHGKTYLSTIAEAYGH